MSFIMDDIVTVNVTTGSEVMGDVNMGIPCLFCNKADLIAGKVFAEDSRKEMTTLSDVAGLFETTSETYRAASVWFSAGGVAGFMYMRADADDPIESAQKAIDARFFYHALFTKDVFVSQSDMLALAAWGDANMVYNWFGSTEANIYDSSKTDDIVSRLRALGSRHVSIAPRLTETIATYPEQIYAIFGEAALFSRVNYRGVNTAITAEHKAIPNVVGEELTNTQYVTLKNKKATMFIKIKSGDQSVASSSRYTWSMSNKGEFADDVINIDALVFAIQNGTFNLLRSENKVGITPQGQAQAIEQVATTCRQFFTNGVLGAGNIQNPVTKEQEFCEYGFKIYTKPEDVLNISRAQKQNRDLIPINLRVNLARAAHNITYDLTIV